eukprot:COSAG02_NODE_114_length_35585_cov_149.458293_8_plen_55_part_00
MWDCGCAADCIQIDPAVIGLAVLAGLLQACDSVVALHEICGLCSNHYTHKINSG